MLYVVRIKNTKHWMNFNAPPPPPIWTALFARVRGKVITTGQNSMPQQPISLCNTKQCHRSSKLAHHFTLARIPPSSSQARLLCMSSRTGCSAAQGRWFCGPRAGQSVIQGRWLCCPSSLLWAGLPQCP